MITNRFSRQLYVKVVVTLLALFPVVLFALILIFVAIVSAVNFNVEGFEALTLIEKLTNFYLFILGLSWTLGLFVAIVGRSCYKTYARQVIDFDRRDVEVKKILVTDQKVKITYADDYGIHSKTIKYRDYGIRVKVRDNFKVPTFFSRNGKIDRVVLPYVEDGDAVFNDYKVK